MANQDIIIVKNIVKTLKEKQIKQSQLAEKMNLPRQTVNKMLNLTRVISATEMKQIAMILETTIDSFFEITEENFQQNTLRNIVDKVENEKSKETILIADELINMIIFHRNAAKKFKNTAIGDKE